MRATALQRAGTCGSSIQLQQRRVVKASFASPCVRGRSLSVVVRAGPAVDDDEELEKRLAKLRQAKGATPYGQGAKAASTKAPEAPAAPKKKKEKVVYDFTDEKLHYEGPPHRGDLAVNLLLGTTLFWLPLTIAAVGRGAFVKYRFTDRRISVITNAPWKNEQLDAAYQEVKEVRVLPRGVGAWGDMVVVLRDGSKVEMRSLDKFRELKEYIEKRRDELAPRDTSQISQEELLGEAASSSSSSKGKKGFA